MEASDTLIADALIKIKDYEVSAIPDSSRIDHTFSDKFEKKMESIVSSFEKKGKYVSLRRSVLTKAAVILVTVCLGFFSVLMISPTVRADFKNAVTEFYETHIKFRFATSDTTADDFQTVENVLAGYIPQGFILKEAREEYEAIRYLYENTADSLTYEIFVSLNDGLSVITDKDREKVEEIRINGRDCYLISGENDGKPYSTCIITGSKITVTVYGQLTREEIIKVSESVEEKQPTDR